MSDTKVIIRTLPTSGEPVQVRFRMPSPTSGTLTAKLGGSARAFQVSGRGPVQEAHQVDLLDYSRRTLSQWGEADGGTTFEVTLEHSADGQTTTASDSKAIVEIG